MFPIVLALIVCGAFATPTPNVEEPLIVGGRPAVFGEVTYQASLRYIKNGEHFCGGSIISINWILTAAHCIQNLGVFDVSVHVGTTQLSTKGKSYYVTQLTAHSSFNPGTNENDIALLRILSYIGGANGVSVINLPDTPVPVGVNLRLSGWGVTEYPSNTPSNDLQIIDVRSISLDECQKLLPEYPIIETNICTYMEAGQGACRGDYGGPLVHNATQYGIVSWGVPCAKGNPDVYTNVHAYRPWIKAISRL